MAALARRVAQVPPSATTAMANAARALKAQGVAVISLAIGEPDFATPRHAIEAGYQSALRGETKYPPTDGIPPLKQAVQRKFRRDQGLDFALDEIMVSNGAKQAVMSALMATLDEGDEVVIPAPYWGSYPLQAAMLGGVPVAVRCPQNNGFRLRPDDLDAAITPRTKWLVLNFPNNPTGAACTREQMAALGAVMLRHPQVWVLSDDIYEHLVYDGFAHATMAAVEPRLRDRTLTISGVSKTYAMTGWRVGFAAGPKALIRAMTAMQGNCTSGISTVGQAAAAAALDGPQDEAARHLESYRHRRDLVVAALEDCPGVTCHKPEGAFYVYPNIAGCLGRTTAGGRRLATDEDFALALLSEQHVAVVQGSAFGMSPYVRISYATDDASLAEACTRIKAFCSALS